MFEKRGALGLAAVRSRTPKQLDLVDAEGGAVKLDPSRALFQLGRRVPPGDPRALKAALKQLQRELLAGQAPCDPDALWDRLSDERAYDLAGLAAACYGSAGDAEVIATAAGLVEPSGRLAEAIRLRPDGFRRTPPAAYLRIRERRAKEAERRAREQVFLAWFEPLRAGREPPPPTPVTEDELGKLRAWALQGDEAPEAKPTRALAGRLGLSDPDAALAELERLRLVPRHVNEVPLRTGLRREFPAEVLAAAEALLAAESPPAGLDLRKVPTVAIDDPGTSEVDDALSAWEEDGRWKLAVHIARVADCVRPGDLLDREARRRATTVYFPGESTPMFPPDLFEERWSLIEGVDRPALTMICELDPQGGLLRGHPTFTRSTVRVARQHPYQDDPADPVVGDLLRRLLPLAKALRAARRERGAVQLELPHVKIRFDEGGDPYPTLAPREGAAHLVVSEMMVLYNASLAEALVAAGVPALFRVQPNRPAAPSHPEGDPLGQVLYRRTLPPTHVGPDPGPHRTVGVEAYLQSTSPIRRYGDLLAQRQLLAHLDGAPAPHDRAGVLAVQAELEPAERRARQAEEDRERYLLTAWLGRCGRELPGFVTRSEPRRLSCWIPELGRELPVRLEGGAAAPPVGAPVSLRVARALPRQRTVDLQLL